MSGINVEPYIFFKGNAAEAMEFYKSIFGGEIETMSYDAMHIPVPEGFTGENLMHASLKNSDVALMASDTIEASEVSKKITISLAGEDEEKLTAIFNGLSEGVEVKYPLKKESWGDIFGSITDKYGVEWMVNIGTATQ
ncbi:MAG: VOC family protein [Candidatus Saccharibacteria bacterium]|nr:VOC family protein [Candidatus Saccharibacteria bacterium]